MIADDGAMMYKDNGYYFSDGSAKSSQGDLFDKLVGAGKRLLTGENLFMTVFTHRSAGKAKSKWMILTKT